MGTRSFIGKLNKDDTITAVYCHFDGYPEHNGKVLINSYITESAVDSLINGGDMSSLGATLDECSFYKNLGDRHVDAKTYSSFDEFIRDGREVWAEFFYLFNHDFWSCFESDGKRYDLHKIMDDDSEED